MRALDLLGLAAEAEGLHLRRLLVEQRRMLFWHASAAGFAASSIVLLHIAAWYALADLGGVVPATLVLAALDALLALLFFLLGQTRRNAVGDEALQIRQAMLQCLANETLRPPLLEAGLGMLKSVRAVYRSRRS